MKIFFERKKKMRIITVNLPVSYLKAIESLTGGDGLYPSRSELIRVAVRNFLIRELESAKSFEKYQQSIQKSQESKEPEPINKELDENLFVQVPIGNETAGEGEKFKTYKLIKKEGR